MKAKNRIVWKNDIAIKNYGVVVKVVNGNSPLLKALAHSTITRERYMLDTETQFLSWAAFDLCLGTVMAEILYDMMRKLIQ